MTEYGIADCRSKTDAEIIKVMLNITDSRFQSDLLKTAKKFGKVESDYEIPAAFKNNYPETIEVMISEYRSKGFFKPFPLGTEFTDVEIILEHALLYLKNCSKLKLIMLLTKSLFMSASDKTKPYLERMDLSKTKNFKEFIYKKLLIGALANS